MNSWQDAGHERNVVLFVMNRWDKMLEWKECCTICDEQVRQDAGMKGMLHYLWWTGETRCWNERNVVLFVMNRWQGCWTWKECCTICDEQVRQDAGMKGMLWYLLWTGDKMLDMKGMLCCLWWTGDKDAAWGAECDWDFCCGSRRDVERLAVKTTPGMWWR